MAKTLPTAIQNGKAGNVEIVLLFYVSTSPIGSYYWATRQIVVTDFEQPGLDPTFYGETILQDSIGEIVQSIDLEAGGNVAALGGCSFKVANPQWSGNTRAEQTFLAAISPFTFLNRQVKIYMAMTSEDTVAFADILKIYTGYIANVRWDYAAVEFVLQDGGLSRHIEIPNLIINKTTYPQASERQIGQRPPLVYGAISGGSAEGSGVFAPPAIFVSRNDLKWVVSRNQAKSFSGGQIFLWCDDVEVWVQLTDQIGSNATFWYTRPSTASMFSGYEVYGQIATPLRGEAGVSFPAGLPLHLATDNDPSTYVSLSSGYKLFGKAPVPEDIGEVIDEDELSFVVTFGTISGTGTVTAYNPLYGAGTGAYATGASIDSGDSDSTVTWGFGNSKTGWHGRNDDHSDEDDMWTLNDIKNLEFGVIADSGASIQVSHMAIRLTGVLLNSAFYKRLARASNTRPQSFVIPIPIIGSNKEVRGLRSDDAYCAQVDGEAFGSWIDTEGRTNPFDWGDRVDDGVYIIETLLRSELGLLDAQINCESFDGIAGTGSGLPRQNWNRGGVVRDAQNSLEIIRGICRETGLIYYTNHEGKETIQALSAGVATQKTIDRTSIIEDGIHISYSDQMYIYNDFEIIYKKRWVPESYTKRRYLNLSATNMDSNTRDAEEGDTMATYTDLCGGSLVRTGIGRKMILECDWIRYDSEADRFLKWMAEWFCLPKTIVEIETAGWDHIELEIGDQVLFDHTLLPSAENENDHFVLFDMRMDLIRNREKLKFMKVPYLLP